MRWITGWIGLVLVVLVSQAPARGQCGAWDERFFSPVPGLEGTVYASAVFDDGTGPALYAGGGFQALAGVPFGGIAQWNGASWSALGGGMTDTSSGAHVYALAVFDDGTGPALYAGGQFFAAGGVPASNVARWNGASWSAVGAPGGGISNTVAALAVFDDGTGPALYAGGQFTTAGGVPASNVARWNGTSWSALGAPGSGTNSIVRCFAVFDDGSGPALVAAGSFTSAGGSSALRIARWNGTSWSALGGGFPGAPASVDVNSLAVFDAGSGPALYAGGRFTTAGAVAASRVARWNGTSWSALGSGTNNDVHALAAFDDGSGPALVAGGRFTTAGGVPVLQIARWNGSSWSALGPPGGGTLGWVHSLTVFDGGSGPALVAGGDFLNAGGVSAARIASWDGAGWSPIGAIGHGLNGTVEAFAVHDDGSGPALYAGGAFTIAGGVYATRIARWNGASWTTLGPPFSGMDRTVLALASFDDGSGPALYAGGEFTTAGGVSAPSIARWNGTSWSALGAPGSGMNGYVDALTVFDDGSGPALYAGGRFSSAGGVSALHVARWNGTSWMALGSGLSNWVSTLVVFDDGSGPALVAGGHFTVAGGVPAERIAKWDGASWSPLGSGMNNIVHSLGVFDDGSGPALYAGGFFGIAGGVSALRIAKWNGTSWSAVGESGSGMSFQVHALAAFDDGSAHALYAGGGFLTADGVLAPYLARWDGTSWSALGAPGSGMNNHVRALAVFDDGSDGDADLYVGGGFSVSGPVDSHFVAEWQSCASAGAPMCFGDGTLADHVTPCPCGNDGAAGNGCANSFNAAGANLATSGSTLHDDVVLHGTGMPATSTCTYLQGDGRDDVPFGDGVRCVGGTLLRLRTKFNAGGASSFPDSVVETVSLSQRGGVTIGSGAVRYYQTNYRNAAASFCPPTTVNVTNGIRIVW